MELTIDSFLAKLFGLFPQERRSGIAWTEAYKEVLSDKNIDFEGLYKRMISKYKGSTAPTPAWFLENIVYKKADTSDNKYVEFKSLWAYHEGHKHWYEYGVEPHIGVDATKRALVKQGFTKVTEHNPYWSK